MREVTFRKIAKQNKDKWCCAKCKTTTVSNMGIIQANDSFVGSNETLSNLADSVKFLSNQFDDFRTQLLDVLNSNKELKEENKSLRENNCKLYVDIRNLTKKVNALEQKSIITNVEILGVPEKTNENCVEVIEHIATELGVKLIVLNAFRMYSKVTNKPRKIITKLNSIENKHLMDISKKRKLNTKNLDENLDFGNIFINNELSSFDRDLFFKARMFAKNNDFKFVWYKDFKIFIKKNENAKAHIVQDDLDLSKLR